MYILYLCTFVLCPMYLCTFYVQTVGPAFASWPYIINLAGRGGRARQRKPGEDGWWQLTLKKQPCFVHIPYSTVVTLKVLKDGMAAKHHPIYGIPSRPMLIGSRCASSRATGVILHRRTYYNII